MAFVALHRIGIRDRPALAVSVAYDALAVFTDCSLHAGFLMRRGVLLPHTAALMAGVLCEGHDWQRQTCSQHSNPQLLHRYSSICVSFVLGPCHRLGQPALRCCSRVVVSVGTFHPANSRSATSFAIP